MGELSFNQNGESEFRRGVVLCEESLLARLEPLAQLLERDESSRVVCTAVQ